MKILVIRLSSLGDVILTTPVLAAIRSKYPDAVLDFLVMDTCLEAIRGNSHIDHLIAFEKRRYPGVIGLFRFAGELKKNGYDVVVDLHAKLRARVISGMLGARVLRYRKRAWWKSLLVPLGIMKYHADDTIVRNYFRPLKRLGIDFTGEKLEFSFTPEDSSRVSHYRNFVVMAPGAANPTKKWPWEYFAKLGKPLSKTVILIGGKEDVDDCERIQNEIGPRCLNLAGRLSLKQSGALLSLADYLIANDSAPFHIARALDKKVFVIFGPTDPGMFEFNQNTVLLYQGVECSPCSLHGERKCPKGHLRCMKDLTPEKAYRAILASR